MQKTLHKISSITFVGLFCVFLFLVTTSKPSISQTNNAQIRFDTKFEGIASVIDGDSIIVNDGIEKREVRLFGIDAPELKQTCFNAKDEEYPCGVAAAAFLFKMVNKKHITCYYSQKDVYNRFLAKCNLGRTAINQEMIKAGMAIIYDYSQAGAITQNLEKSAQLRKKGIWEGKFQDPKDYRKSNPYKK